MNGGALQSASCSCDCSNSVIYGGQECTCKTKSHIVSMDTLISFSQHVNVKMEALAVDPHVTVHLGTLECCVRLHVQKAVHWLLSEKLQLWSVEKSFGTFPVYRIVSKKSNCLISHDA